MSLEPMSPIAVLDGVSKSYSGHRVLADFNFALKPKSITALLGPNGAGKSTVAGLLTGRLLPDAGSVQLFGHDPRNRLARARMAIMLQSGGLPDTLTVAEAIDLHASYFARRLSTESILEMAGLTDIAERRCGKLSGGQQRKVQFALAIAGAPDLVVLDEPTTGFDPDARRNLWQLVRAKADAGAAVLLATHHMDEAEALADRIVVIADGRILADGPPADIKAQVAGTVLKLRTRLPAARFKTLPNVIKVEEHGTDLAVLTTTPRATLEAAFQIDTQLEHFEVVSARLEDALDHLVYQKSTPKEAA